MQVSKLAQQTEIPAHVIRYYTRKGLLSPIRNPLNNYRDYADSDIYRLRFIRRATLIGFALREIKAILLDADSGRSPCPEVREIIKIRLGDIRQRHEELLRLQKRVMAAISLWETMPDNLPPSNESLCHLIDAVAHI